jgi:hypothetical protein
MIIEDYLGRIVQPMRGCCPQPYRWQISSIDAACDRIVLHVLYRGIRVGACIEASWQAFRQAAYHGTVRI